jgi:hypothetical protein
VTVSKALEMRLGADVGNHSRGATIAYIQRFIESCSLRDFLDSLTVIYGALAEPYGREMANEWRKYCSEVFEQENLQYQIDSGCGVHNAVDTEFQYQSAAAIENLGKSGYAKAREQFEHGFSELRKPSGSKYVALRSLFDACETVTKDKYEVPRLTRSVVLDKVMKAAVVKAQNDAEKKAIEQYVKSFGEWIDALHVYRHSHEENVPLEPSLEWAIDLFSTGSSFLRWLTRL